MKIVVMERDGSYVDIISVTKEFWKNELPKFLVEAEYKEEGESSDVYDERRVGTKLER